MKIRPDGMVYIAVSAASCLIVLLLASVVADPVYRARHPQETVPIIIFAIGIPSLLVVIFKSMYIKVTNSEIACWQGNLLPQRALLNEIYEVIEDRWGSSGTLYGAAIAHGLIIRSKRGTRSREFVINLKPYLDKDVQLLFDTLRERGVPGKYGEHPTSHRYSRTRKKKDDQQSEQ